MRYDPVDDVAPPRLGSWWRDRLTGQLAEVVSFRRFINHTEVVTLSPGEMVLPYATFRAEYVPADPPPKDAA